MTDRERSHARGAAPNRAPWNFSNAAESGHVLRTETVRAPSKRSAENRLGALLLLEAIPVDSINELGRI